MGIKTSWRDKVDNEDFILAEDINKLAHAIIELEDALGKIQTSSIPDGEEMVF